MNALPLTLSLLALAAIATLARLQTGRDDHLLGHTLLQHIEAERSIETAYQCDLYQLRCSTDLKPQASDKPSKPKQSSSPKKPTKRRRRLPQYPSHLNLAPLPTSSLHTEILAKLLEHLDHPPELAQCLADKMAELPSPDEFQGKLELTEQLACLDLGPLQHAWAKALRDGLLDLVAISGDAKINVAWAPRPLLLALFEDDQIADAIIASREQLVDEYLSEQTTEENSQLLARKSKDFESSVALLCSHTPLYGRYKQILDFSLRHKPTQITLTSTSRLPLKKRRRF